MGIATLLKNLGEVVPDLAKSASMSADAKWIMEWNRELATEAQKYWTPGKLNQNLIESTENFMAKYGVDADTAQSMAEGQQKFYMTNPSLKEHDLVADIAKLDGFDAVSYLYKLKSDNWYDLEELKAAPPNTEVGIISAAEADLASGYPDQVVVDSIKQYMLNGKLPVLKETDDPDYITAVAKAHKDLNVHYIPMLKQSKVDVSAVDLTAPIPFNEQMVAFAKVPQEIMDEVAAQANVAPHFLYSALNQFKPGPLKVQTVKEVVDLASALHRGKGYLLSDSYTLAANKVLFTNGSQELKDKILKQKLYELGFEKDEIKAFMLNVDTTAAYHHIDPLNNSIQEQEKAVLETFFSATNTSIGDAANLIKQNATLVPKAAPQALQQQSEKVQALNKLTNAGFSPKVADAIVSEFGKKYILQTSEDADQLTELYNLNASPNGKIDPVTLDFSTPPSTPKPTAAPAQSSGTTVLSSTSTFNAKIASLTEADYPGVFKADPPNKNSLTLLWNDLHSSIHYAQDDAINKLIEKMPDMAAAIFKAGKKIGVNNDVITTVLHHHTHSKVKEFSGKIWDYATPRDVATSPNKVLAATNVYSGDYRRAPIEAYDRLNLRNVHEKFLFDSMWYTRGTHNRLDESIARFRTRALEAGLTDLENLLINFYTRTGDGWLNSYARNPKWIDQNMFDEPLLKERHEATMKAIGDALKKLPVHKLEPGKILVRGLNRYYDNKDLFKMFKDAFKSKNKVWQEPGLLSSTTKSRDEDLQLHIHETKTGRYIESLTEFPGEHEVLHPPGSKWKIHGIDDNGDRKIVYMSEITE